MLKSRINFTRLVLPFFIIPVWILTGGLGFLPEIQEVQAITVGTPSTDTCDCSQLTISSHNISGTDPMILVGISLDDGDVNKTVNTVTYNGTNLTRLVKIQGEWHGSTNASEIWYLNPSLNPTDGNYDVVITIDNGDTNEITAGVITFTDVDQTTPIDTSTVQSNGGKSKDDILTVISAEDDLVMNIATTATLSLTPDASQAEMWNLEVGGSGVTGHFGGASTKSGAASVSMKYTFKNASSEFSHAAFNINAAGAAASSFTPPPPPHPPFQGSIIQKSRNTR
ncbi:transcriptional regulator [Candidatus Scalindua japonica]|uniref:Transcriptional regulator n=1 Tax=Candidatus Scalindua japonica TaxID=1284222 RepID=A0A286U3H6_9BACT|nr:hypothetical protein [Candidatus Scalindua japonica]GAX62698.1 transcriptional regulator [Candidatus Scalindua japonica]